MQGAATERRSVCARGPALAAVESQAVEGVPRPHRVRQAPYVPALDQRRAVLDLQRLPGACQLVLDRRLPLRHLWPQYLAHPLLGPVLASVHALLRPRGRALPNLTVFEALELALRAAMRTLEGAVMGTHGPSCIDRNDGRVVTQP